MKIGEHEVTGITRDSAMVGCQRVTRSEVEAVLEQMKAVPALSFHITSGQSKDAGAVYLEKRGESVVLKYVPHVGAFAYDILQLSKDGIHRSCGCQGVNLPLENVDGKFGFVKISPENR